MSRIYPTEQEASSTLGRLIASGLITVEAPYFKATDSGRRIIRRAHGPWWRGWWSGGTIEEVDRILRCLRASGSATSFVEHRRRWVASGCAWWGREDRRPVGWTGADQLTAAGLTTDA